MADPTKRPAARRPAGQQPGLPGTIRRWAPLALLGLIALLAWQIADRSDIDDASVDQIAYDHELATPVLSVRRIPQTLQAPIADSALIPELTEILDASPEASCLIVFVEGRNLIDSETPASLVPASNQKLISTYAALGLLGPDTVFRTRVTADTPAAGVLESNLYLIGGGDPFLTTDGWWSQYESDENTGLEGRARTRLEDLADRIAATGITTVTGSVVGDESRYDTVRTGDWAQRLIDSRQSGPLSALAVNQGYESWPSTFSGTFRPRQPAAQPAALAAQVLTDLLIERGITIEGAPTSGTAPADSNEIASIDSPPLIEIITHINSYSDNYGAELLVKEIGLAGSRTGSTAAGTAAITDFLTAQGLPTEGVRVVDGSGLAETNTVTCDLLVALLDAAGPDSDFVRSLSIGGVRGSLAERHQDTPAQGHVFAKTGTLNDVTALSGVVESPIDEDIELTFAYVVNGELVGQSAEVRDLQIPLVESMARYPQAPPLEALAPLPALAVPVGADGDSEQPGG